MNPSDPQIVVAGHVCLDLIPSILEQSRKLEELLIPGNLVEIGPSILAAGGAVSNTGIALSRLGIRVRLMGKVGDDLYGQALLRLLRTYDDGLADEMIVSTGEHTSYTIVLSPPGMDRTFLHHPGANDTFRASDVVLNRLHGVSFFHFGYPPLMRRMYLGDGAEMAALFTQVKARGLFVSLDMAMPDQQAESGHVNWRSWLMRVLPEVDLFAPSFDEILFMLNRHETDGASVSVHAELADELLKMGAGMVLLKWGDRGLYLRTGPDADRLKPWLSDAWVNRELLAPCFRVDVAGTTGAGDCTVAGFLAALAQNAPPEKASTTATAVGAFSVEASDSTSGIPALDIVQARISAGWAQRHFKTPPAAWRWNDTHSLWHGPNDSDSALPAA